jgi:hypothetical protein
MVCDWVKPIADVAGITAFISWARILPFLNKLFLDKTHTDAATVHESGYKIKRKKSLMLRPAASANTDPLPSPLPLCFEILLVHPLPRAVRIEKFHGLSRLLRVPAQIFLIDHSILIHDEGHDA